MKRGVEFRHAKYLRPIAKIILVADDTLGVGFMLSAVPPSSSGQLCARLHGPSLRLTFVWAYYFEGISLAGRLVFTQALITDTTAIRHGSLSHLFCGQHIGPSQSSDRSLG